MTRRSLARDSDAAAAIVGSLIVLAILGLAIVYVNTAYVPRQGERLEAQASAEAELALRALASGMAGEPAPLRQELPLRPERAAPPLLAGIILSPLRADGTFTFDPALTNVTVSLVTDAPAGGVSPGDGSRVAMPNGTMRVYLLGNATRGAPVGSAGLALARGYLAESEMRLEAGAVVARHGAGSTLVSPPTLHVARVDSAQPLTRITWRIPILAGAETELGGSGGIDASLVPGPVASAGGLAGARSVSIAIESHSLAAWREALEKAVGPQGSVTTNATGPDRGTVTATIASPAGTPAGMNGVEVALSLVRYDATFSARGG